MKELHKIEYFEKGSSLPDGIYLASLDWADLAFYSSVKIASEKKKDLQVQWFEVSKHKNCSLKDVWMNFDELYRIADRDFNIKNLAD